MKKITIFLSLLIIFACEDDKDETPPTVAITNIQANAELSDVVSVTVDANDNDAIALVEFFVNGALYGTSESSEAIHTFNWDTDVGENGSYQIYAKATDESDNSASSSIITVNVINYRLVTVRSTVIVAVGYKIDNEGDWIIIAPNETSEFEVPKKDEKMMVKLVKDEMTSVAKSDYHSFSTPLTVDVNVGDNWGMLH